MSPPPSSSLPSSGSSNTNTNSLLDALADVLPAGYTFGVYHLSTPPTRTAALFPAPPGGRPDRTYCESHFLSVTVDVGESEEKDRVLVFALEVLVFSTAFCTTVFVSKADSSGALALLRLPRGAPSPVRAVAAAFVAHLVAHRRERRQPDGSSVVPAVQTVVSLFARAQAQYLFPGSVENPGKHVLDDRGLVRWWCRVLDPLVGDVVGDAGGSSPWKTVRGYLMVPGLELHETRALLPAARRVAAAAGSVLSSSPWVLGHPLEHVSHYVRELGAARVPPRCLVPQYPDDPKSRFRDELDDEAEARTVVPSKLKAPLSDGEADDRHGTGAWKSVRSLDQFWEMMAFRQECSSGRMTGFLWVVFDPEGEPVDVDSQAAAAAAPKPKTKKTKKKKVVLRGRIVPRAPRIKTVADHRHGRNDDNADDDDDNGAPPPTTTAYYAWPRAGRGARIVAEPDYKRAVELLLQLDFASRDKAVRSTWRWIGEAGMGSDWRRAVAGRCAFTETAVRPTTPPTSTTTTTGAGTRASPALLSGLVKRKRAPSVAATTASDHGDTNAAPVTSETAPVRVLSAGLVRKKPKAV